MNLEKLNKSIDEILPDELIIKDILDYFFKCKEKGSIEVDDDVWVYIDKNTKYEVITKLCIFEHNHLMGFGEYKVKVAVGGIKNIINNNIKPNICFVLVHYTSDIQLITVDILNEML